MAGDTLIIDMHDDDLLPAWQTVIDVAGTGIAPRLTLVGGLMVAVHARRAGVVMMRPTDAMSRNDRRRLLALLDRSGSRLIRAG